MGGAPEGPEGVGRERDRKATPDQLPPPDRGTCLAVSLEKEKGSDPGDRLAGPRGDRRGGHTGDAKTNPSAGSPQKKTHR